MPDQPALILVVEDDDSQRDILDYNLKRTGYQTLVASDGDEAEVLLAEESPDLALLDWMLPGVSGLELARRIRARKSTRDIPIIMLTALGEVEDMVRGLDVGADDYIVKPYSTAELLARIRSALRRIRPDESDVLTVGPIEMHLAAHRVVVSGSEVSVGPLEYKLLRTLMEKPGRIFERDDLLDRVWGRDVYVGTRTVDVHIGRLRKALEPEGSKLIRTVRGSGYGIG